MRSITRFLAVSSLVLMGASAPYSYADNHAQATKPQPMSKQQMTSAQVVLQQNEQLNITIHTPLRNLFHSTQWPGKPANLAQLADAGDQELESFRKAIRNMFRKELKVTVNDEPLSAQKVRLPNLVQIKHALRTMYLQDRPMPPANMEPPPRPNSNGMGEQNGMQPGQGTQPRPEGLQQGQGGMPPRQNSMTQDQMNPNMRTQQPPTPASRQASMMSRRDSVSIRVSGRIPEGTQTPQLEIQFPKAVGKVMVSYSRPQVQNIKRGGQYIQRLD